jgi:DNA modification methylase
MEYPQPHPLLHKAQKPLELIRKLIVCSSNEGDLVLDPFLGVGTTALACKFEKRRCIGIDNEKKFLEIAVKRLKSKNEEELKIIDRSLPETLLEDQRLVIRNPRLVKLTKMF